MSKIVFLGAPAYGHVNPTLPVVQELVGRGEQVVYYNTEEFRPQIEQTGATFHAYEGANISSAEISAALQDGNLGNIGAWILHTTAALTPFVLEELPRQQPDLVMLDSMAMWGWIAATRLKLPIAASISHFVIDVPHIMAEDSFALRYLFQLLPTIPGMLWTNFRLKRRFRDAFPKTRPIFPVRGGLNFLYTIRELQRPTPIIDDTFRFVGPSINPQTRDTDFPLDALTHETIVYISLGTVHHTQTEFYKACFAAFGDYPAQFVLSAGRDTDIKVLGDIPVKFIVRPSVPQLEVLQRATVFITHGGLNSIHEGLYYGVPLVIIPQQIEQLLNARSVEKLGAGLIIDKRMAGKQVTAEDLRQALETVLSQPRHREAATKVQQTLRATGGYRQAADEIQAYIARS
jgi:MGT family glycosyltransferase